MSKICPECGEDLFLLDGGRAFQSVLICRRFECDYEEPYEPNEGVTVDEKYIVTTEEPPEE